MDIDHYRQTARDHKRAPSMSQTPAWLALLVLLLTWGAAAVLNAPPAPLSSERDATEFSAERAQASLSSLLGEEQRPHPMGSAANRDVRNRLTQALTDLGLKPELQKTTGCAANAPVCGYVENVIAVIPAAHPDASTTDADVLLLMAHYDSVSPSPGAGDNGAGVVAILEAVRAWQMQDHLNKNNIVLLFTDGEEQGLLGAEAFFTEHPLRGRVHAVINLEGAGSGGGPANLLRSANRAGFLIDAYRRGAEYPAAMSVVQEVFSRMPNDTDFSVAERAGVPSLDFAFGSEFNHYHSRLDTIENLDSGTLQHHGENLLPLLEQLHSADLRLRKPGYVYQNIGPVWLHWPEAASVPLAIGVLLMLMIAGWRVGLSAGQSVSGVLHAIIALFLSAAICACLMALAHHWLGSIASFPDSFSPWWLLMFGSALLGPLVVVAVSQRRANPPTFWPLFIGFWLLLALLGLLFAAVVPKAANLITIPGVLLALATLVVAFVRPLPAPTLQMGLVSGSCVALGTLFLGLAPAMLESQGLTLAPAIYLMLSIALLPLVATASSRRLTATAGLVTLLGLCWALNAPMYSAERPQFVSIHYQQNVDTKEANWLAYAPNPLPERLTEVLPYAQAMTLRFPWESTPIDVSKTRAPWVEISRGELRSQMDEQGLMLNYASDASVEHVTFVLPNALVGQLRINGKPVGYRPNRQTGHLLFRFYAPNRGSELELIITPPVTNAGRPAINPSPLYLMEGRSGLPPAGAAQLAARGATAMPRHRGDQWLTYRRIITP